MNFVTAKSMDAIWTGPDDIPRLREFLTANYGDAISVDDQYEILATTSE